MTFDIGGGLGKKAKTCTAPEPRNPIKRHDAIGCGARDLTGMVFGRGEERTLKEAANEAAGHGINEEITYLSLVWKVERC